MPRKVSHFRRIEGRERLPLAKIRVGTIIEFKYLISRERRAEERGTQVHDRKPLVYVVDKRGDDVRGFNLNYMKEYFVGMLLEEKEAPKSTSVSYIRKLKKWEFYQDAFRTYKKTKMSMIQEIDYLTNAEIKERKKDR
jgi:hypothetical protein